MTLSEVINQVKSPPGLGVRHLQMLLLVLGELLSAFIRMDMSLAIVDMTDSTQENAFDWSLQTQSIILSSYKWCYVISKIPGGELSARFGGKVVMIWSVVLTIIATLLVPTAAFYGGWKAVCACRVVVGLSQGTLIPALYTLVSKWIPVQERGFFSGLIHAGSYLGFSIQYFVAGNLAYRWGWQAIFYNNGIALVVWVVLYSILGSSSPGQSKMIGAEEKTYIQKALGHVENKKRIKTPWLAMLTSVPFLVLTITQVGVGWGYWVLLSGMPTYIKNILGVSIKANGALSALPYLVGCFTNLFFGFMSDFTLRKGLVSITNSRKIFNSISTYGPAIVLLAVCFAPRDVALVIALFAISVGLQTAYSCGFYVVHFDMAPNHAGTMVGFTGFVSNTISAFAPLSIGFLVLDESLQSEWRKVFYLCIGVYIVTNTIFVLFGTCDRQKWNDEDETKDSNKDNEKTV